MLFKLLNRGRYRRPAAAIAVLILSVFAQASHAELEKIIAGWVEEISLADSGYIIKAKLDTGAKTSSIHAENIEQFKRDGQSWVRFEFKVEQEGEIQTLLIEKPRQRRVRIKEHSGDHDRRPVVEIDICFNGRRYPVEFTLADRSQFIYPVILGRRFLEGVAVVDAEATFLTQAPCQQAQDQQ